VQHLIHFALRPTNPSEIFAESAYSRLAVTIAGLLANLTCIQAELYEMEAALSVGEDPLWIIPYTTIAEDFQYLLNDFTTYLTVSSLLR